MEFCLWACGIIAAFVLSAVIWKKTEIIENAIVAVIGYFCLYIIISGLLFWTDIFNIRWTECIVLIVEIIGLIMFGKSIDFRLLHFQTRQNIIPVIICIVMLPVIWNKFEVYGMGQDEGIYQIKAISLMEGETKNQQLIDSYEKIPEEAREEYLNIIQRKLVGFYLYDDTLPTLEAGGEIGDTGGFYHGVATYPAILALWGSIAGIKNMVGIQTLLYVCSVFLMFYICRNIRAGKEIGGVCTSVYAISPIVVWTAKSALTEIMLVCLVEIFIYFLTEKNEKQYILGSALPIIAFSFFHITIYTIIPVVFLIYVVLYLFEGKKEYLISNILTLVGFSAGIYMMAQTAATYSFTFNFSPLYRMTGFITSENVLVILVGAGIFGVITSLALRICIGNRVPLNRNKCTNGYKWTRFTVKGAFILVLLLNIFVIFKETMQTGLFQAVRLSTLTGYGLFTGGVLLICGAIGTVIRTDIILRDKTGHLIGMLFLYTVLIYSSIFSSRVHYYYYYGRYLVPYIPCVILMGAVIIKEIRNRVLKTACVVGTVFVAFALAFMYNIVLVNEKDDTRLSWQALSDCAELFEEKDSVIIGKELVPTLFLPLTYMTDAEIYMQYEEFFEDQSKDIKNPETGCIYFVTDEFYGLPQWEIMYAGYYEKSEANNEEVTLIPLPRSMKKERCQLYVYAYHPIQYEYFLNDENMLVNGFNKIEGDRRWTNGRGAVYCYLEQAEYELHIKQGNKVPLQELGRESMTISLYFNDIHIIDYILNLENMQDDIIVTIPAEVVRNGKNELVIKSDSWSPMEYGSSDSRQLGVNLKSVNFVD